MKFPTVDYQLSYREMYDRWKELKRYVETSILKDLHYAGKIDKDTYLTSDANWGLNMGTIWISDFMREMEKK